MADQKKKKDQQVNMENIGLEMGNRPPQALDFEEAVLGALLIEPNCVDEAMEELTTNSFYSPKHKMIFEAMSELVNEHIAIDLLSVSQKLQSKGNLEAVGGAVTLAALFPENRCGCEYRLLHQNLEAEDYPEGPYHRFGGDFEGFLR